MKKIACLLCGIFSIGLFYLNFYLQSLPWYGIVWWSFPTSVLLWLIDFIIVTISLGLLVQIIDDKFYIMED